MKMETDTANGRGLHIYIYVGIYRWPVCRRGVFFCYCANNNN